jgi:hypothetical protein
MRSMNRWKDNAEACLTDWRGELNSVVQDGITLCSLITKVTNFGFRMRWLNS